MKATEIQTYRDKKRAERATALRSLNANRRGETSQMEVRELGPTGFVGGPCGELAKRFPTARVVAQWSAGYRI